MRHPGLHLRQAQGKHQAVSVSRGALCGSMASWIFANAHAMFATSITASERQRAIACTAGVAQWKLSLRQRGSRPSSTCYGASGLNDKHYTGQTEQRA